MHRLKDHPLLMFSEFMGAHHTKFQTFSQDDVRCASTIKLRNLRTNPVGSWRIMRKYRLHSSQFMFNKSVSDGNFPLTFRSNLKSCFGLSWNHFNSQKELLARSSSCLVSNYHPISNLSYLSKLLERAIKGQLLAHMNGNISLPECQSAYCPCHSTELKISSDALVAAEHQMYAHTSQTKW